MGFLSGAAFTFIVFKAIELHKENKSSGTGTTPTSGGNSTPNKPSVK